MLINKIRKYIKNPSLILLKLSDKKIIQISDKKFYELQYLSVFNKHLSLKKPQTFNEKLNWLKLNDRKEIYTTMVDKIAVKDYVSNILGDEYIIPTYGIYDSFDEINFDELPDKFVIKCNHYGGSDGVFICEKNKSNFKKIENDINKTLKKNLFEFAREWPYKNVKPRIIIEKYMNNKDNSDLKDYKFFVFNGKVKCFKIDFDRFSEHKANYYDIKGNLLKFGEEVCPPDFNKQLEIPNNIKEMIEVSEKLSNDNPFVRVDLYDIDNKIYFGEITLYPAAGFGKFIPEEWDKKLGDMIELSIDK